MTKKIRLIFLVGTVFAVSLPAMGCGSIPDIPFHSLLEQQPYVTRMIPSPRSALEGPAELVITFSQRIALNEIDSNSVALLKGEVEAPVLSDTKKLLDGILSGDLSQQEVEYFLSEDERTLTVLPKPPIAERVYHLAVTPKLKSSSGIPFNQRPGERPTAYVANYSYGKTTRPSSSPEASGPNYDPEPEWLVINEILYDSLGSEADGEAFIELYGEAGADISLYALSLINGADGEETDRILLPPGSQIPEAGIHVVADLRTGSGTNTKVSYFNYLDQFDPQNGPDAIHLLNREGVTVDGVAYGEGGLATTAEGLPIGEGAPAPDVTAGHSLSRQAGGDTQDNQVDFIDLAAPTPGTL
jgi:hypothetical protein